MKSVFQKMICLSGALALALSMSACGAVAAEAKTAAKSALSVPGAKVLTLSGDSAALDGTAVEVFDYTWHCDPGAVHDEVKNAPAEYHTGTKPETEAAVYIDRDLCYYPALPEDGFRLVNYDGEQEWAYYYTDGKNEDYIFATLPRLGQALPTQMMHSEEEAAKNQILHITQPGVYVLEGTWNGQIRVDLGDKDDTFSDPDAKITVYLNGVDVNCTVAPGIVFYSAYECDNEWEDRESHSYEVDTADAGVTVVLADGSENTVSGTNVFRMLKTKYKDEDSTDAVKLQKKQRKEDGAFYSYVSMNLEAQEQGTGSLTVNGGFEGLDSELHLSIKGGNITINSQDDGINVNEDHVSVATFLGGTVTINAAQGAEGDGVDSNGYIVVDGGTVSVNGIRQPDSPLDSDDGTYYRSGTVIVDGETQDYKAGDVIRERFGGGFGGHGPMGENFDLEDFQKKVAALKEDATLEDILELLGLNMGFGGRQPEGGQPDGKGPGGNSFGGKRPDGDSFGGKQDRFASGRTPMGEDFDLEDFQKKIAALDKDATYEEVLELLGIDIGFGGGRPEGGPFGGDPDGVSGATPEDQSVPQRGTPDATASATPEADTDSRQKPQKA